MNAYDGSIRINTKLNTQGFDRGISAMRATLGKFATAVGIAFSVTALVKLGQQAIELASDIQEVDNVVSKSFGNMRSEMDALADSAIKNLGMSRLTAYRTGSTFMAMGKSMLDSATDAKDMALALTKLTANMSSFYNVSQDIASTALKSIYTGETETLKQFGVVMTEVNLQQFAFEQGIQKKISAMTQSEKVMLRYKYVTEQLAFIGNDFIDTQDSWANQTRILKEQWKELLSILGSGLITVLTPVVKTLNMVVSALISFANMVGQILSKLFGIKAQKFGMDGVGDSFDGIADSAGSAIDATEGYGDAIEEAGKKAKGALLSFDDLNVLQQQTSSSGGSSGSGIGGGSGSGIVSEDVEPVADVFEELDERLQKILELLEPVTDALKKLWNEGLKELKEFTFGTLKDFYHDFLVPVGLWTIGEGLPRFINITNDLLKEIDWDRLRNSLDDFYKALANLTTIALDGWLDFYEYFLKPLAVWTMSEALPQILDILTDFEREVDWESLNSALERFWQAIEPYAEQFGQGLIDFFEDMKDIGVFFINKLSDAISFLAEVLEDGNPEDARAWGYALGVLAVGLKAFSLIKGGIKAFETFVNTLERLGKIKSSGSKLLTGYTTTLEELGKVLGGNGVLGNAAFNVGIWEMFQQDAKIRESASALEELLNNIPQEEDYATYEEYAQAVDEARYSLEQFSKTQINPLNIEVDEDGINKKIADLRDKINDMFLGDDAEYFNHPLWKWDIEGYWNESIKPSMENIMTELQTWWNGIDEYWSENAPLAWVPDWFKNDVSPWFTKEKWSSLWNDVKEAFSAKWSEISVWWKDTAIYKWWNDDVSPWFEKETWADLWEDVKKAFSEKWEQIVKWWNETAIVKWWKNDVEPWFKKEKWLGILKGIKEAFEEIFENIRETIEESFGGIFKKVDELSSKIKGIKTSGAALAGAGAVSTSLGSLSVPHLATGAVIPPNSKFLAMLGDQTSGYNIEAPASLIKDMVLQGIHESGGMGAGGVIELTVNLTGKQIHKEVVAVDKIFKKSTGHSAFEHK